MPLEAQIQAIRANLEARAYQNEAAVSVGVVLPILRLLGWSDTDPMQVVPEFSIKGLFVDFALLSLTRRPAVLVEVKRVGRSATGDEQLLGYAFHSGVPICVLTDGQTWGFYYPSADGALIERRLAHIDLMECDPAIAAKTIDRYLCRSKVLSGAARDAMEADYQSLRTQREVDRCLPEAWRDLLASADASIISALQDRTERLARARPTEDDVRAFMQDQLTRPVVAKAPAGNNVPAQANPQSPQRMGRRVTFRVLGEDFEEKDAASALVAVLGQLALRFPDRVEDMSDRTQGHKYRHIARTLAEIRPAQSNQTQPRAFHQDWMVGLNITNPVKEKIVQTCCQVVGLSFDKDVVFRLQTRN